MYNTPTINNSHKITNYAILKDSRVPLTKLQFDKIEFSKNTEKSNKLIEVRDPITNNQLFYWEIWSIKGFSEIKQDSYKWKNYICDFAIRHPLNAECLCKEKYNLFWIEFKVQAIKLFWVHYMQDLSELQRTEVLRSFNN